MLKGALAGECKRVTEGKLEERPAGAVTFWVQGSGGSVPNLSASCPSSCNPQSGNSGAAADATGPCGRVQAMPQPQGRGGQVQQGQAEAARRSRRRRPCTGGPSVCGRGMRVLCGGAAYGAEAGADSDGWLLQGGAGSAGARHSRAAGGRGSATHGCGSWSGSWSGRGHGLGSCCGCVPLGWGSGSCPPCKRRGAREGGRLSRPGASDEMRSAGSGEPLDLLIPHRRGATAATFVRHGGGAAGRRVGELLLVRSAANDRGSTSSTPTHRERRRQAGDR